MSFQIDLERGKSWEDELMEACRDYFGSATKSPVSQQKQHGGDFTVSTEGSTLHVECKHDFAAKRTGNLYLELTVSYPDKAPIPGWTAKLPDNCVVVWKVADDEYYMLNELEIAQELAKNLRVVSFNKKIPGSTGALLPTKRLAKFMSVDSLLPVIADELEAIIAVDSEIQM